MKDTTETSNMKDTTETSNQSYDKPAQAKARYDWIEHSRMIGGGDPAGAGLGALGAQQARAAQSPQRLPLRYRAELALQDAERLIQKAGAARRVLDLLNAHPELGELLDLVNEF